MLKNKFFILSDQILVSGGNFLTVLLCANLLSFTDQGNLIISLSLYMVTLLFSIALIYSAIAVLSHKVENIIIYNYTISIFHSVLSILFIVVFLFLYPFLTMFFDYTVDLQTYLALLVFIFFQQYADFARRASYITSPSGRRAFFYSLVTYAPRIIALFLLQTPSLFFVFLILASTAFLLFFLVQLQILYAKLVLKTAFSFTEFKHHLSFSKHLAQSVPIVWLSSYLPIFFLGAFSGAKAVAIIGTLRNITNLANVFIEIIEVSQISKWVMLEKENKTSQVNREFKTIIILFVAGWSLILALFIFGIKYFSYFLNTSYLEYQAILVILWITYLAYFFSRMYTLKLRTLENTHFEKTYAMASCLIAVPASVLSYWFSIQGAAVAFLIIALLPLIYLGFTNQKYTINPAKRIF